MRKAIATASAVLLALLISMSVSASGRPHEGKITRVDQTAMVMTVQGEKGDSWDLYWTETTKLKNNLTVEELREGDSVHFDFIKKDGRMLLTELRRTHKAKAGY